MSKESYWTAIATVVPVIALALAVEYRNTRWKRFSQRWGRWVGLFRAALVMALANCEYLALATLRGASSSEAWEKVALVVVGLAAFNILVTPAAPMLYVAYLGFSKPIRTLGRDIRRDRVSARQRDREWRRAEKEVSEELNEIRLDLVEFVILNPELVFDEQGGLVSAGPLKYALARRRAAEIEVRKRLNAISVKRAKQKKRMDSISRQYEKAVRKHVNKGLKYYGFERHE